MLITVIKKEILENVLSYRFPLFLIICVLLIVSSLYVNYLDYSKRLSDYNEQLRLSTNAITASRMWDVVSGNVPLKGFRPPSPLSIVAHGFERSLPLYYEFQTDGYKAGETAIGDESILSILGRFDFVFTVQMVLSLIVLLFAADTVSGEKELGTLRSTLSNSIPRHNLLLGKLAGGNIALWIPIIIGMLLAAIVLSVTSYPLLIPSTLVPMLIVFVTALLFILMYFSIGLMISSSTTRSRTSLVAVLLVWIFFQLLIPKLSDVVASIIDPIRTETVVSMQKSLLVKTLDEEKGKLLGRQYETFFGAGTRVSSEPGTPEQRAQWDEFRKKVEQQYRTRKAEQVAAIDDAYDKERRTQQAIANRISLISPSAAFSRFATDLCGTGESAKAIYVLSVRNHEQILQQALYSHVDRTTMIMPSGGTTSMSSIDKMVDLETLPEFTIFKPALSDIVLANTGSLISLAFWLVAPFVVAYVRFLRYDVR